MDPAPAQLAASFADGRRLWGSLGAFGPLEWAALGLMLLLAGVCVVWGLRLPAEYRGRGRLHRAAAALMPLAIFLVALLYLRRIGLAPYEPWNGTLLAPTVALAHGYDLYYGRDTGPIQVTEYGPVSHIVYLPAALAGTPTPAILIAEAITVLLVLSPLLLLLLQGRWKERRQHIAALAGFVFAAGALTLVDASKDFITKIGPDAPAVGLGLLSCLVIMGTRETPTHRRLALCALLATLSCWAKQIEAPLILAQALYLGIAHGRRTAFWFLAWVLVMGTAAGLGFVAVFRFENMSWHMFIKHTQRPWDRTLFEDGFILLRQSAVFIVLVVVASVVAWEFARRSGLGRRGWLRENPWALLVAAAVFLFPTGALSDAILGGGHNSYHSAYYLVAASALILVQFATTGASGSVRKNAARLLFLFAAWALVCQPTAFVPTQALFARTEDPEQQAYAFTRKHPGEAYFPWHPLAALMAEGRLYHSEPGVVDRIEARYEPTDSHFRAHLPPDIRYMIFRERAESQRILNFLPEFQSTVQLRALSGWVVYARDEETRPASRPRPLTGAAP